MHVSVTASDPAVAAFILIPPLLVSGLLWGVIVAWRRSGATDSATSRAALIAGVAAFAWMAGTWRIAAAGVLRHWDRRPPPFVVLVVLIAALAGFLAFGPAGRRLAQFVPLWILVAVQAFRLPLELAMHSLYERGIMPAQMSYSGRNFDIVTGATAIVVALLVATGRAGHRLVLVWNVLGLALLVNVLTIAILSTPVVAYFGEDRLNVFVTDPPFVWLPAVMVLAALAGHLVIFRALGASARGASRRTP